MKTFAMPFLMTVLASTLMSCGGAAVYHREAPPYNTESYSFINENRFTSPLNSPLSTFSVDVDTASYSNVRRFLNYGSLPPRDSVRIEEMINYFDYSYKPPVNGDPFSLTLEMGKCYWNTSNQLVLIGLKGKLVNPETLPPNNIVFLCDVSGSMKDENKLPLLKQSVSHFLKNLRAQDKVAIVVYAGAAGVVLPSTSCSEKGKILKAFDKLHSGGSTAGGKGIALAYKIAEENFIKDGNNRVILATDGDFNIGPSSDSEMVQLIEQKRESGVYLTVLGFGMGNYKDSKMEELSNAGNGNYAYIDNLQESKKVLGKQIWGTIYTIANDVKLQIEFNPKFVKSYRLIGYVNRVMKTEDFNDDKKDAGDIGAGHMVTALYEIVPQKTNDAVSVDDLEYQKKIIVDQNSMMTLKLRYKVPGSKKSTLMKIQKSYNELYKEETSESFRYAASVAEFGMLLRNSPFKGSATYTQVRELAGEHSDVEKKEFIELVKKAESLSAKNE